VGLTSPLASQGVKGEREMSKWRRGGTEMSGGESLVSRRKGGEKRCWKNRTIS